MENLKYAGWEAVINHASKDFRETVDRNRLSREEYRSIRNDLENITRKYYYYYYFERTFGRKF